MHEIELQLAHLERAPSLKVRQPLITALEQQGFEVFYKDGCYRARRGQEQYWVPRKRCGLCGRHQLLSSFLGTTTSTFIQPWCASCRKQDPQGAKHAYDNRLHHEQWKAASEEEKARKLAYNRARRHQQRLAKQARQQPEEIPAAHTDQAIPSDPS